MRIFKQQYKTKSGRMKQCSKYYIELKDHLGVLRKYPGFSDKRLTFALGSRIELLTAFKRAGQPPDAQICEWLQGISKKLSDRLAKIGLIDMNRVAAGRPLIEHLNDYRLSIGDITQHARTSYSALKKIFSECKFVYWSDVQASRLYNHLINLRTKNKISQRTFNKWLKACRAFCSWMVQDRRASESPISHLRPVTITIREVDRRALEDSELKRLLDTTATGPKRYGMRGYERYLLYRFAVESGFRAGEIRSLVVRNFDFINRTVTIQAGSSKRKRQDVQVLKPDTTELLKEFLKNKTPEVKAFGGTYKHLTSRTGEMIRADLAAAGIPYEDESGRIFDFHGLRHQTGTMLARAGVHPRDAMEFMRHSSIEITMKYYTHLRKGAEVETAAKLPDLSLPEIDEQAG